MDRTGYDIFGAVSYELKDGNGYAKLYNNVNNRLMFEGQYLNGEKNGKCRKIL